MEKKLPWTQRVRLFQKGVVALTIVFFLLMILTVMAAFARRSGSTGMDPAKIQIDRVKFHQNKINS